MVGREGRRIAGSSGASVISIITVCSNPVFFCFSVAPLRFMKWSMERDFGHELTLCFLFFCFVLLNFVSSLVMFSIPRLLYLVYIIYISLSISSLS